MVSTINKVYVMSVVLIKPQLTIMMETIVIGIVQRKEINNVSRRSNMGLYDNDRNSFNTVNISGNKGD